MLVVLFTVTGLSEVFPILAVTLVAKALPSSFLKLVPVMVTEIVSLLLRPVVGLIAVTVGAGVVSMMMGPKW